jgi:hypothetical protein
MMKGESELAARSSFERGKSNAHAWENCRLGVRTPTKLNIPPLGASHRSILGKGTPVDDTVSGNQRLLSIIDFSAWIQHGLWNSTLNQANAVRILKAVARIPIEPHKSFQDSIANAPGPSLGTGDRP